MWQTDAIKDLPVAISSNSSSQLQLPSISRIQYGGNLIDAFVNSYGYDYELTL